MECRHARAAAGGATQDGVAAERTEADKLQQVKRAEGDGETEGERRAAAVAAKLRASVGRWRRGPSGGWRPRVGRSSLLQDALKRENTGLWRAPVCSASFTGCTEDAAG
jgi:hypothetical protein